MDIELVKIKPPQLAWLLIALSVGLHVALPKEYRGDFSCAVCGVVSLALGFFVMTWAWWLFKRSGTPIRPTDRASFLVTSGPFRFTRNPMYLGILAILVGITLWLGSWPMLVAPVGFFVFMSFFFIPHEERMLRDIFGEAYTSYSRRVRRWI
jgi:protein-S-isoprenylcysteine O-methyltransferase Ste14